MFKIKKELAKAETKLHNNDNTQTQISEITKLLAASQNLIVAYRYQSLVFSRAI